MQVKLTIQERLKDLRCERKLTLEQLSEKVGVSKSALGNYESDTYKDMSPFAIARLARFYGVSTDYLLGLTENKDREGGDIAELHLSDEALEKLRAGTFNHRLLSEIIMHDGFPQLMTDIEIVVDRIAEMRVQSMDYILDKARQEVIAQHNPGKNDLHLHTIDQALRLDEKSFFGYVVHEDLDAIMYDIREAHKNDPMTADEGSIPAKDTVMEKIQQAMDCKTAAEFLAKQFCDTMQIPMEKVSENEMIMLINLLGKSPQIKNLNSMRGRTQTPHGPGKRKRRR
ncbi:MAG: helix-turn-helix transcriptional regulator [Oscillospiraceae bacterium]|nr:helix-turn-helix transcriptional regulator [Bacillota bacterium]MBQ1401754.1 helix-turn-helix transcriptional regulator [Oscillospiraceae bacterium]